MVVTVLALTKHGPQKRALFVSQLEAQEGSRPIKVQSALKASDEVFSESSIRVTPLRSEVATFGVLLLLLYFAVGGIFSFEVGARNSAVGAATAGISSGDSSSLLKERIVFLVLLFLTRSVWADLIFLLRRHGWLFAIGASAILSSIWSQDPRTTFSAGLRLLIDLLFVIYLFKRYSPQRLMRLLVMLGWTVGIASVGFVLLLPRFGIDNQDARGAWQGIFSHKNFCGYVLVFLMSPVFFLCRRGFIDQVHRIAYCLFLGLIIVLSQSRTSWTLLFVLFVLVTMFQVISRFRNRDAVVLAFCLFLVLGVVACASFSLMPVLFVMMGKDPTLNGRLEIWQPVMRSIIKRPLTGYGYCAFWTGLSGESGLIGSIVGWVPPHAHNGFLNVALQVGVPGLMVLMAAWFVGVREAILRFQMGEKREAGWYLTLLMLNTVVNISEPTLLFYNNLVWLMFLMACVGAGRTTSS